MKKIWFITGCSTGFGKLLAEEVLAAGDSACITARKVETLAEFATKYPQTALCLPLDVTQPKQIHDAVESAVKKFSHIDVLVNNAGYGILGAFEEVPEKDMREMMETNVFGLLEVTRSVLPQMRKQKSGFIVNMSSIAGFVASPGFSIYNTSKFAVEGFSEGLAIDVRPLGIKVTIVEPGPFRTDFAGRSLKRFQSIKDYEESTRVQREMISKIEGHQPGDPIRAAKAILELSRMSDPPLRLAMGKVAYDRFNKKLDTMKASLEEWKEKIFATDYPDANFVDPVHGKK